MAFYRCNACNWTVPADEIGVGLMRQHLTGCDPSQTSTGVDAPPEERASHTDAHTDSG